MSKDLQQPRSAAGVGRQHQSRASKTSKYDPDSSSGSAGNARRQQQTVHQLASVGSHSSMGAAVRTIGESELGPVRMSYYGTYSRVVMVAIDASPAAKYAFHCTSVSVNSCVCFVGANSLTYRTSLCHHVCVGMGAFK